MTARAIVIMGNGRSGANWVMEVLNGSPSICKTDTCSIATENHFNQRGGYRRTLVVCVAQSRD